MKKSRFVSFPDLLIDTALAPAYRKSAFFKRLSKQVLRPPFARMSSSGREAQPGKALPNEPPILERLSLDQLGLFAAGDFGKPRSTDRCPRVASGDYAYDAASQMTSATDPLSRKTTFGYTVRSFLASVTDPLGDVTQYTYNSSDDKITGAQSEKGGTGVSSFFGE